MIDIDNIKCNKCGICLAIRGGYCLNKYGNMIEIDRRLCNDCSQCIAICPSKAFSMTGASVERIDRTKLPAFSSLAELFKSRRSTRHFTDKKIDRETLAKLIGLSRYVPTMNQHIEAIAIDERTIIDKIDRIAFDFYSSVYKLVFKNRFFFNFIKLFSKTLDVIKAKLEHGIKDGFVIYKAPALVLFIADKKIPMSETSAQYYLYNIILAAETLGLTTCLMDSVKIIIRAKPAIKKILGIPKNFKVMGAVLIGHPDVKVLNKVENIPMKTSWNIRS